MTFSIAVFRKIAAKVSLGRKSNPKQERFIYFFLLRRIQTAAKFTANAHVAAADMCGKLELLLFFAATQQSAAPAYVFLSCVNEP